MARVELDHARAVRASRGDLPLGLDGSIPPGRDDDVAGSERCGNRLEPRLAA